MTSAYYRTLSVLIADDATPVLMFLRKLLVQLGFTEEHIKLAKSSKECLQLCASHAFDLVLCDYNFGTGLNGRQILEELRHRKLLKQSAAFVVITGESNGNVVQAVVGLKPDEYLLKPTTPEMLQQRIGRALLRRKLLLPLHEAIANNQLERAIELCDELAVWQPQFLFYLREQKGQLLRQTKRTTEATALYQQALLESRSDWARLGLAHALLDGGHSAQAREVLAPYVQDRPASADLHDGLARCALVEGRWPEAISHLNKAHRLARDTSNRDRFLSDLAYCVDDASGCISHYQRYRQASLGTCHDAETNPLNQVRRQLMVFNLLAKSDQTASLQQICQYLGKPANDRNKLSVQLCKAHLLLLNDRVKQASTLIRAIYAGGQLSHFYDLQHLAHLLLALELHDEFRATCNNALISLGDSGEVMAVEIRQAMLDHLEKQHQQQQLQFRQFMNDWQKMLHHPDPQLRLQLLLNQRRKRPHQLEIARLLLQQLKSAWPHGMLRQEVQQLEMECQETIDNLV